MPLWHALGTALTITWFVAVMMILVEYGNVLSVDRMRAALSGSRWTQVVVAALLGATPGCLGAFVVVALYLHRSVRLGAVVACMIATSGDEAFVMLALFPRTALLLTLALLVLGIAAGVLTDAVAASALSIESCGGMVIHDTAQACKCFDPATIRGQLRRPSAIRFSLTITLVLLMLAMLAGWMGPTHWNWVRVTFLILSSCALFVVVTSPEHFVAEHLWRHVMVRHVPRIFLWTFGSMTVVAVLHSSLDGASLLRDNPWLTLVGAAALGLIPESGPQLIVVMLYAAGSVPFSILLANSVVQDGHGMLPLLAHSWRDFLKVKAINLVVGVLAGAVLLLAGG
jgi:hypothetical protein